MSYFIHFLVYTTVIYCVLLVVLRLIFKLLLGFRYRL